MRMSSFLSVLTSPDSRAQRMLPTPSALIRPKKDIWRGHLPGGNVNRPVFTTPFPSLNNKIQKKKPRRETPKHFLISHYQTQTPPSAKTTSNIPTVTPNPTKFLHNLPKGYELVKINDLTSNHEVIPWKKAKEILQVSSTPLPPAIPPYKIWKRNPPISPDLPSLPISMHFPASSTTASSVKGPIINSIPPKVIHFGSDFTRLESKGNPVPIGVNSLTEGLPPVPRHTTPSRIIITPKGSTPHHPSTRSTPKPIQFTSIRPPPTTTFRHPTTTTFRPPTTPRSTTTTTRTSSPKRSSARSTSVIKPLTFTTTNYKTIHDPHNTNSFKSVLFNAGVLPSQNNKIYSNDYPSKRHVFRSQQHSGRPIMMERAELNHIQYPDIKSLEHVSSSILLNDAIQKQYYTSPSPVYKHRIINVPTRVPTRPTLIHIPTKPSSRVVHIVTRVPSKFLDTIGHIPETGHTSYKHNIRQPITYGASPSASPDYVKSLNVQSYKYPNYHLPPPIPSRPHHHPLLPHHPLPPHPPRPSSYPLHRYDRKILVGNHTKRIYITPDKDDKIHIELPPNISLADFLQRIHFKIPSEDESKKVFSAPTKFLAPLAETIKQTTTIHITKKPVSSTVLLQRSFSSPTANPFLLTTTTSHSSLYQQQLLIQLLNLQLKVFKQCRDTPLMISIRRDVASLVSTVSELKDQRKNDAESIPKQVEKRLKNTFEDMSIMRKNINETLMRTILSSRSDAPSEEDEVNIQILQTELERLGGMIGDQRSNKSCRYGSEQIKETSPFTTQNWFTSTPATTPNPFTTTITTSTSNNVFRTFKVGAKLNPEPISSSFRGGASSTITVTGDGVNSVPQKLVEESTQNPQIEAEKIFLLQQRRLLIEEKNKLDEERRQLANLCSHSTMILHQSVKYKNSQRRLKDDYDEVVYTDDNDWSSSDWQPSYKSSYIINPTKEVNENHGSKSFKRPSDDFKFYDTKTNSYIIQGHGLLESSDEVSFNSSPLEVILYPDSAKELLNSSAGKTKSYVIDPLLNEKGSATIGKERDNLTISDFYYLGQGLMKLFYTFFINTILVEKYGTNIIIVGKLTKSANHQFSSERRINVNAIMFNFERECEPKRLIKNGCDSMINF
ncbi:unnamed protein product [Lepeophtheirus salmonis]|uniref:(salmon louse) hypothetical protein n=1 Tax=Lepeophtheirus salmonis TaxID=72036 RepID=A0A7R8CJM6_LEPSM|nr:unnamed protein product [Lepeophtheirus salmonis]CAF2843283.1 unnamed protein product [Lepeophtheirus salmonis]